jgi:hypothetical protein
LLLEGIEMNCLKIAIALILMSSTAIAQPLTKAYFFMFDENKNSWCGYTNEVKFQELSGKIQPLESARILYKAEVISEITYQVQPESGDWIVIDKYTLSQSGTNLRRAIVFAQSGALVIKEGQIAKGGRNHLSLISATKSDGSKVNIKNLDFPPMAVQDDLSKFTFMKVAQSMKNRSLQTLCQQVK